MAKSKKHVITRQRKGCCTLSNPFTLDRLFSVGYVTIVIYTQWFRLSFVKMDKSHDKLYLKLIQVNATAEQ